MIDPSSLLHIAQCNGEGCVFGRGWLHSVEHLVICKDGEKHRYVKREAVVIGKFYEIQIENGATALVVGLVNYSIGSSCGADAAVAAIDLPLKPPHGALQVEEKYVKYYTADYIKSVTTTAMVHRCGTPITVDIAPVEHLDAWTKQFCFWRHLKVSVGVGANMRMKQFEKHMDLVNFIERGTVAARLKCVSQAALANIEDYCGLNFQKGMEGIRGPELAKRTLYATNVVRPAPQPRCRASISPTVRACR